MGTSDAQQLCQSCSGSMKECPGHFGHIELAKPVFHYGLINEVLRVLRCVCYKCSKLLTDQNKVSTRMAIKCKDPKKRGHMILKACAGIKTCAMEDEEEDRGTSISTENKKIPHNGCGAK